MKDLWLMAAAAVAAFAIPVQAIVNGRLGLVVGNPFVAALISFLAGTVALIGVVGISSGGMPRLPPVAQIDWYLYSGGLLGAVFVTVVLALVPKIGPANVVAATIFGQLVMALVLDHFGILGMPKNPVTAVRLLGACLLVLGTWLIQRG
jgi:transporter family-2 protein